MEQQQQAENNKQRIISKLTASASSQTSPLAHLDPIQSIANVLNRHHLEQQKSKQKQQQQQNLQQKPRQVSTGRGKNFVSARSTSSSVVAQENAADDDDDHDHKHSLLEEEEISSSSELQPRQKSRGLKGVQQQQQVDRVTGRPLLLTADSNNNSSSNHNDRKPKRQGGENCSRHHQSDQKSAPLATPADQLQQQQQRSQEAATTTTSVFKHLLQADSNISATAATTQTAATTTTNRSDKTQASQVDQGNSYLYAYNDFITPPAAARDLSSASSAANQTQELAKSNEQRQHNSRIARQQQQQQRLNNRSLLTEKNLLLPQVCLLTGETLSTLAHSTRTSQQTAVVGDPEGEEEEEEKEEEEEDAEAEEYTEEEDDGEDTLSYILNRHNLLVAQQQQQQVNHRHHQNCNLLHLDQLQQRQQQLICNHPQQQTSAIENPNHLRQYLQIEENFNSYKAARRRRGAQQHEPASTLYASANTNNDENEQATQISNDQQQASLLSLQANSNSNNNNTTSQPQVHLPSSSLSSSLSSLNPHLASSNRVSLLQHHEQQDQQHQQQQHLHSATRNYLQFLNRIALPLTSIKQWPAGHHHNQHQKMLSASKQVGQAGAYYVTSDSSNLAPNVPTPTNTSSSHQDRQQQELHHHHHLQQQQQQPSANNHLTHAHHLGHHHHHHHLHQPHLASGPHHLGQHHHHRQHLHHSASYPITSSDSSLGSSGPFASGAMRRTTGWLRDFCSKRCLFVSCLMMILFILILVISLSAYLNFLISSSKTNLQPMSGRLRVQMAELISSATNPSEATTTTTTSATNSSASQMMRALTKNKTSSEFLQKQRDFETILRGALDRTQTMLKTYPNHLVKLEVYSFRPTTATSATSQQQQIQQPTTATSTSLWVYFRLFLNKRTLQQDGQLMKRKSPDEHFDRQFLPRLTQQTLRDGFEQLIASFGTNASNRLAGASNQDDRLDELSTGQSSQVGINSRRFGQQQASPPPPVDLVVVSGAGRRSSRTIAVASGSYQSALSPSAHQKQQQQQQQQQQQLKSFDEQISRLMPLIEAIDLQSIYVAPEFDLMQTMHQQQQQAQQLLPSTSQIMSETLRASQPLLTTTTSTSTTTPSSTSTATSADVVTLANGAAESQDVSLSNQNSNNNKLSSSATSGSTGVKLERQLTTRQPADSADATEQSAAAAPPPPTSSTTRKFTLAQNYRENATRPSVERSPTTTTTTTTTAAATTPTTTSRPPATSTAKESLFLLKHQQKPPVRAQATQVQQATTGKPPLQSTTPTTTTTTRQLQASGVVRLVSGQPVVSQSGQKLEERQASQARPSSNKLPQGGNSLFVNVPAFSKHHQQQQQQQQQQQNNLAATTQQPPATQQPRQNLAASSSARPPTTTPTTTSTSTVRSGGQSSSVKPAVSIEELWQNAFGNSNNKLDVSTIDVANSLNTSSETQAAESSQPAAGRPRQLITVTTIGAATNGANNENDKQSASDWRHHKISVLSSDVSDTIRAQLNASLRNSSSSSSGSSAPQTTALTPPTTTTTTTPSTTTSTTSTTSARPAKVAPHLNLAGSIISTSGGGGGGGDTNNQKLQQRQQQQHQQQHSSAVVLNRDLSSSSGGGNNNNSTSTTTTTTRSSQQPKLKQKQKNQSQRISNNNNSSAAANDPAVRVHTHRSSSSNSTAQRPPNGPQQKPAKVKKVVSAPSSTSVDGLAKNDSAPRGESGDLAALSPSSSKPPTANGKGIRIVDNFLASIGSAAAAADNKTTTVRQQSSSSSSNNNNNNKEQSFLPTTIELTRSTTAMPQTSTTTTVSSADESSPPPPRSNGQQTFVIASQQARPGTTSFSGQWRPLGPSSSAAASTSSSSDEAQPAVVDFWSAAAPQATSGNSNSNSNSNRNGTRARGTTNTGSNKPGSNLSLIIAAERLPANLNRATGSQSPFAMPSSTLMQAQFSNRFRAPAQQLVAASAPPRTTPPTNDFESHRVSRMRSSQAHSHHSSDLSDPFGGSSSSSSSSTSGSSSMSTSSSSTTTMSSLNLVEAPSPVPPGNTRIVDDFMITTDRSEDGRATTLLPPLVLSSLHKSALAAAAAATTSARGQPQPEQEPALDTPTLSLVVAQGPRRTRGPFAFETLRSFRPASTEASSESISTPSEPSSPFEPAPSSASIRSGRSSDFRQQQRLRNNEQQQQQQRVIDDNLLLRKRLFVPDSVAEPELGPQLQPAAAADDDDLSFSPSTNAPISARTANALEASSGDSLELPALFGSRFGRQQEQLGEQSSSPSRCQYFGCKSRRAPGEFVCLNSTQICDDAIDCQDESDELDCVSLLKLDAKTNRMSFSNGAGIIYLNRRGSLAPMCIDYATTTTTTTTNTTTTTTTTTHHDDDDNSSAIKRQNELIRQINAIGQYACGLQSFSRLVSVKINHHDLVDGFKRIRSSKQFHLLAIRGQYQAESEAAAKEDQTGSFESFRAASGGYQVAITTSSECPSQRTVFVKCGGFECGQSSSSSSDVVAAQTTTTTDQSAAPPATRGQQSNTKTSAITMDDFPWLVKLYHLNSLACHGYLIDESWLIAASECFTTPTNQTNDDLTSTATATTTTTTSTSTGTASASGWTAEISYEHYGNDDYKSIESNRRRVKEVLFQSPDHTTPQTPGASSAPIVLAKLERPVRFSPLNRPICLPLAPTTTPRTVNKTATTNGLHYKDCITVTLPVSSSGGLDSNLAASTRTSSTSGLVVPSSSSPPPPPPTPGLVLNKVELMPRAEDCLQQPLDADLRRDQPPLAGNLICANEITPTPTKMRPVNDDDDDAGQQSDATRVLICSSSQSHNNHNNYNNKPPRSSNRSKWIVVGVQFKQQPPQGDGADDEPLQLPLQPNRRLFASVSSRIDWIVDAMNPKSSASTNNNNDDDDDDNNNRVNPYHQSEDSNNLNNLAASQTNGSLHWPASNQLNSNFGQHQHQPQQPHTNELNLLFNNNQQQQQTCNRFKCSSGECLSWSRICDGLYDCSSHDDEKDCHK